MLTDVMRQHCGCCWATRCRERSCSVPLPRSGDVACLSGSQYRDNHDPKRKMCDCIVAWSNDGDDIVGAVELKSGTPDIAHAGRQVQQGAALIEEIIGNSDAPEFFPVVVSGGITSVEMAVLRRTKI